VRNPANTLDCLSEECSEVIKEVCKIHRFGPDSAHPDEPDIPNTKRLEQEIGDLLAVVQLVVEETGLGLTYAGIEDAKTRKLAKLERYLPRID